MMPHVGIALGLIRVFLQLVIACVGGGHIPLDKPVNNDVLCRSCNDASSPESCTSYEMCGWDEICFTREYIDDKGRHAYRLGCESRQICDMYKTLQTMVGRRDTPRLCFQCCDTVQCNTRLCATSFNFTLPTTRTTTRLTSTYIPTTASTTTTTTTTTGPPCLDMGQYCDYWAKSGECARNSGYMLLNCQRSCNQC